MRHKALLKALRRMRVHPEILHAISKIYADPRFYTEVEGIKLDVKR